MKTHEQTEYGDELSDSEDEGDTAGDEEGYDAKKARLTLAWWC